MSTLEKALLAAHARGDGPEMVNLYQQAAAATDDEDQAAFFLTQAFVFALETGDPATATLRQSLIDLGREAPLAPPPLPRR